MMLQNFNGLEVSVHPTNDSNQWYMTIEETARGYGVTRLCIMNHLARHANEIRDGVERSTVTVCDSRSKGGATLTQFMAV